jgi:hypothetical protein
MIKSNKSPTEIWLKLSNILRDSLFSPINHQVEIHECLLPEISFMEMKDSDICSMSDPNVHRACSRRRLTFPNPLRQPFPNAKLHGNAHCISIHDNPARIFANLQIFLQYDHLRTSLVQATETDTEIAQTCLQVHASKKCSKGQATRASANNHNRRLFHVIFTL